MKTGPKPKPPIERFMKYVKPQQSGCWRWTGGIASGYGTFRIGSLTDGTRRPIGAHRFSYEHHRGPISDGLFVCHSCDNKLCVNPDHLFLGTNSENILDASRKGLMRTNPNKGESNGRAVLTAKQVLRIRELRSLGHKMKDLAETYGVTKTHISWIVNRKSWAHI
jgi:hypothetical protein